MAVKANDMVETFLLNGKKSCIVQRFVILSAGSKWQIRAFHTKMKLPLNRRFQVDSVDTMQ